MDVVDQLRFQLFNLQHLILNQRCLTLNDILKERGFELYWEGFRRQDLIRFGRFTDTWQEKPVTDARKALFPIPTSALDVNANLKQNSSY